MHYFSNLFWYRTVHVSDRFTVHHRESSTVYTAIGICRTGYVIFSYNKKQPDALFLKFILV
jgi:hypothetical protein